MAIPKEKKILILCKTYPSPSAKHVETSCVAGMDEEGNHVRLFPVPFRFIDGEQKFKKWQWISAKVIKARSDHRPESHEIYVDTIKLGDIVSKNRQWADRRYWLDKLKRFTDFADIQAANEAEKVSLALLKPTGIDRLEINPVRVPDWTEEEKAKLLQAEQQSELLFSGAQPSKPVPLLKKLPYDFYYHYTCQTDTGEKTYKHKLIDWEVGALFWTCRRDYRENWEAYFRAKLEEDLAQKDLYFLMGNQHRFQDQWLIISLIYPAKLPPEASAQGQLF